MYSIHAQHLKNTGIGTDFTGFQFPAKKKAQGKTKAALLDLI